MPMKELENLHFSIKVNMKHKQIHALHHISTNLNLKSQTYSNIFSDAVWNEKHWMDKNKLEKKITNNPLQVGKV